MIGISGRYRPSNYFLSFNSRPAKHRTELFVGATVLLFFLLVPGSLSVFAQRGTAVAPVLLSITVTPANAQIFPNRVQPFTATGTYSDGSTHDLTSRVTWSSWVPAVATTNRVGGATARAVGRTTIEAALGAINGSTTLNVVLGGRFVLTGSMNTARFAHTATLMNNGMVLVAAGAGHGETASAELYNPASGTFAPTGNMNAARMNFPATLLNNGTVLMAGGCCPVSGTADRYNPATGTFTPTGGMNTARQFQTATLLNDGMVLMAGGQDPSDNILASAELYNPTTGT